MAVEGGVKCIKYLLFFFNFIFWLCGLALILVGFLMQRVINDTFLIKNASGSALPIVLILVGFIIFCISFFGCCGAWKENHCMVTTFALFLSAIILAEIGIVIAGYVYGRKPTGIGNQLNDLFSKYNTTENITKEVDILQRSLHCCGVNSSSYWKPYQPDGQSVPDSCCKNESTGCGKGKMLDGSKVNQEGCQHALEALLGKIMKWAIVVAIVIAVIEIMGVVFACILMKGIRSGYEVM